MRFATLALIYECGIFYLQLLCMRFEQLYRKYYANRFLRCPKRCAVDNTCLTIKNLGFSLTKNFALYPKFFMKPIRKMFISRQAVIPRLQKTVELRWAIICCFNPVQTQACMYGQWDLQKLIGRVKNQKWEGQKS